MDELTSLEDNFSKKWDALLQASAEVLYASLLYEAMFLCNEQDVPPALPKTLEPTANTASLLLKMPVTVLIAALHLALRLDSSETLQGAACARQTCEWYFDALLAPDAHVSATSYERVLRVYVLLVLGAHLHEWNYARDIVDYSTLAPPAKAALQRDVDHAQAADESRAQREEEALERARAVYVEEKARRTSTSPHGQIPTVPASDVNALPSPVPVFQDATIVLQHYNAQRAFVAGLSKQNRRPRPPGMKLPMPCSAMLCNSRLRVDNMMRCLAHFPLARPPS